ncbi:Hsp20/alpha crystallin family protein [Candidatus Bathyarchaeota archaeon]|nr:Hsp20/alpha crystallin family protein [Candidatus Bathyarchaeota archaeon]MBS7613188.1 Hsp20/alpha crystallin family protein [Candidatus Bathyarchaeota archaeon]MBS7618537.1 Hsp20/alpha crystallin family protein [Candidatus Bathyarchaeota archaeon]
MPEPWDEFWDRWFRRRMWPFSTFFERMDEMFREIERTFERELEDLTREVPKDLVREKVLPDGTKVYEWGPFIYGYSITIGPDGRPQVREFGNIKPGVSRRFGRPSVSVREEREPLVEVISTDGEINVVAEVPGVEKEDIKLHATETTLTISAETEKRKYYKEIELPEKVDPKKAKSTYKNGVLEVRLPKKKVEAPKGEPIEIE